MGLSNRAQVTLFIVLGLVLVLISVLFIALREDLITGNNPSVEVTHDFSPVIASYEAAAARCLDSESENVIKTVFLHAGYVRPEEEGFVAIDAYPTKGNALSMGEGFIVPFWLEQKDSPGCTTCRFETHIPPLTRQEDGPRSIEERIADELVAATKPCLDRIKFPEDYEALMADDFDVDVALGDDLITFTLQREVELTYLPNNAQTTIEEVRSRSDASAGMLYQTALDLIEQMELSNQTSSFADIMKHIIIAYGLTDESKIPPMYGGQVLEKGKKRTWLYGDVKNNLELYLADNLQFITIQGSSKSVLFLEDNKFSQGMYGADAFQPYLLFEHARYIQDVSFSFIYDPAWDIELDIWPNNGYLIQPGGIDPVQGIPILSMLPITLTSYDFAYSMRVPILVILKDEQAYNGRGLVLMFALETGMENNEQLIYGDASLDPEAEEDFFDPFNDFDQSLDAVITVTAKDSFTGTPMKDVKITYSCGDETAVMGYTNATGGVDSFLPFCLGGLVVAYMDGYYADPYPLSVLDDQDQSAEVLLLPYQEFKLNLELYPLSKRYFSTPEAFVEEKKIYERYGIETDANLWSLGNSKSFLKADEEALIVLTRKTLPGEKEEIIVKNLNLTTELTETVMLAKGEYDLEVHLIRHLGEGRSMEQLVIPEDEVCWGDGWFDGPKECATIDAITFDTTFLAGGVSRFAADRMALNVTQDSYENNTLVIPVMRFNLADITTHRDVGIIGQVEGYSRMYVNETAPRFIKT